MVDPTTKKLTWKNEIVGIHGFAHVGQPVPAKEKVLINRIMPTVPMATVASGPQAATPMPEYREVPITYKGPISSNVEKVMFSSAEEANIIKTQLRQTWRQVQQSTWSKWSHRSCCRTVRLSFHRAWNLS